jgi:hypothetical protein
MMTIKLLLLMQREEEEIEEVSAKHSKTRKLQQPQVMNREKTYQGFNVSDVTSMDTLQEIVLPGRKEENLHPLSMLIQNHIKEMKTQKMKHSSSSQHSQVRFLQIVTFG